MQSERKAETNDVRFEKIALHKNLRDVLGLHHPFESTFRS